MENSHNVYEESKKDILVLAQKFGLDIQKVEAFLAPNRIVEVNLKVAKSGGTILYKGFRSQHSNKLGPYKGGIRFHSQVTREEVAALSLWMSLKCAIAGIPMGGGKGGVIVNPKILTEKELEELSREYIRKIYDVIGPHIDVPAPDVNTNPTIMSWMIDEYTKLKVKSQKSKVEEIPSEWFATLTGKPLDNHGVAGRTEATGFGGVVVLMELIQKLGLKAADLTVAVQGFGNVGYYFSEIAAQKGFKVIAVSDSKGGIIKGKAESGKGKEETKLHPLPLTLDPKDLFPLDIPLVMECKKEKGSLAGCYCSGGVCDMNGGKQISNEELLELPIDVLVPSALENVINESNMEKIKAKIIIEMANGPVSPTAYEYLSKKGVVIIPDVLANAGGVSCSYIEWKQNLESATYKKEDVLADLKKLMKDAFADVWKTKEEKNCTPKEAAYLVALKKLLD